MSRKSDLFSSRHILLTVSKKYVWNTTAKDIIMPQFIPPMTVFRDPCGRPVVPLMKSTEQWF